MRTPLLRLIVALALTMLGTPAPAQDVPLANASRQLAQAEADVRLVDRRLDEKPDKDARRAFRARTLAAGKAAAAVTTGLTGQLALIDARIAGLGPVHPGGEAAEVRRDRATLAT